MRFDPRQIDQLIEESKVFSLITPGTYDFEVVSATRKLSKAGNDMIELKLKIWDANGVERTIFDYLVTTMAYKLKHFCVATDLMSKFEIGEIEASDCLGKSGIVEITIQKGVRKEDGSSYPDRNSVKDYLIRKEFIMPQKKAINTDLQDDDLPF